MHFIVFPLAFVGVPVLKDALSLALSLAFDNIAFVIVLAKGVVLVADSYFAFSSVDVKGDSVRHNDNTFAVHLVVLPVACVTLSVGKDVRAYAISDSIVIVSFVVVSAWVDIPSDAMSVVVFEEAFVDLAGVPHYHADAVSELRAILDLTDVDKLVTIRTSEHEAPDVSCVTAYELVLTEFVVDILGKHHVE